ncbi:Cutinase multi-domain protein [Pyrenophora teres f. maculata]|nr:Cutinase multi-domain protein [Pyrenophora teres f. maculata]
MRVLLLALLSGSLAVAQQRCDVPSPGIYCNSTDILAYQSDDCKPFHIFVVRGSDEPYPGRLGNLTKQICAEIGGTDVCGFENVEYPAKSTTWGQDVWCDSASKGAKNGQAQMKAYNEKCPDSNLIVLGFSQGGSVAQDMLGGGGGHVFACQQDMNPALDPGPAAKVVAAATFGAVVRSRDQNFTVGQGVHYDGTSPRAPDHLDALNAFSDRFLDYCHYGDPICAVGSRPAQVTEHLNYFVKHNAQVIEWIAAMARVSAGDASVKPSKPILAASPSSMSVAARPAATTGSGSATPSLIGTASVTPSSSSASATQTGTTGAAPSLGATFGYLMAIPLAVAVL